jgi:MtN3 and saliva related transmembrane protein
MNIDVTMVGLIAGALTTGSSIPQVIKIIQTRSARDVSALFFIMMAIGMSLWLAYGLLRADLAIVLWNAISLIFCLTILGLKKVYGAA